MQPLTTPKRPTDLLTGPQAAARMVGVSAIFAVLYHGANLSTGARADVATGLLPWDAAIPFVPWTVLPYLSIVLPYLAAFFFGRSRATLNLHALRVLVLLAIALACYALVPLRHTFQRPAVEGVLGVLFEGLSACDLPYNRAPSLHIGLLVLLWARLCPAVGGAARWLLQGWLLVIGVSVLTTWQHHLIDIPAGLAAGGLALALTSARVRQAAADAAGFRRALRAPRRAPLRSTQPSAR